MTFEKMWRLRFFKDGSKNHYIRYLIRDWIGNEREKRRKG